MLIGFVLTCNGTELIESGQKSDSSFDKNAIYFELFGNGFLSSINYERQIITSFKRKLRTGISIGFMPPFQGFSATVPVELKFLYGRNHSLEIGLGMTFIPYNIINPSYNPAIKRNNDIYYPVYRIGYRFTSNNGIILRVAPIIHTISYTNPNTLYGGISLGATF